MDELTEAQKRKRDEIAESLKADPKFEPLPGRTKEESAFAVATDQAKENPGNPHSDLVTGRIRTFASELEFSGDPVLDSLGMRLGLALDRGDMKKARSVLREMRQEAEVDMEEHAIKLIKDFEEALGEEGAGA